MSFESKMASAVNASFKSMPGYKPINSTWVENIHRLYMSLMAKNIPKPEILPEEKSKNFYLQKWDKKTYQFVKNLVNLSQAPYLTVDRYLRFLRLYAIDGSIPYEKYDPQGYVQTKALQKGFATEKTFFESVGEKIGEPIKKTVSMIPIIILAVGGILAYNLTKKE